MHSATQKSCDVGEPLLLDGQVLDGNCQPIPNATVQIWHANPSGAYDNNSSELRYYGQTGTDAEGGYSFQTLMPGRYLNGSQYRPAHVHIKVSVNGIEQLTTQIYFEGDPFNDVDGFIVDSLIIPLSSEGRGTFNVVLS